MRLNLRTIERNSEMIILGVVVRLVGTLLHQKMLQRSIIPICSQVHVENVLNPQIAYCKKRAAGAKKFRALRLNGQINVFTKLAEIMFNCALCVCPRFYFVDLTTLRFNLSPI